MDLAGYVLAADQGSLDGVLAFLPDRLTVIHRTFVGKERPAFTTIYYNKGEFFLKTL
jgi:hypothetical protein